MSCSSVKTVTISDGIEFIEDGAFAKCNKLENVIFPATLKRIGSIGKRERSYNIFDSCSRGAFESCALKNVILPENLTYLGEYSFSYCRSLKSIDIPNGVTTIQDCTFNHCSALKMVRLPEKLKIIGIRAFCECNGLSKIQFPLALEEIGSGAFLKCGFVSLVLNEGLKKIGSQAFKDCYELKEIVLPSTLEKIDSSGSMVFDSIFGFNSNLIVYCYSGTYGLEYARKNNLTVRNASSYSGI